MPIPILVINLDSSRDRLDEIAQRLRALGLDFIRIAAVDGRTLSQDEKRAAYRRRAWRQTPTDGEIGCYLSHIKALRAIVESGFERAIILEDDTHFSGEFAKIAHGKRALDFAFDVLKLEGINVQGKTYMQKPGTPANIVAIVNTHGAAGYMVTLDSAKRILKRLLPMRYRFDDGLFCNWRNGLVIYDYFPYPVWQGGLPSTITGRTAWNGTALQKRMLHLLRIFPKHYDRVSKSLFLFRRFGVSALRPKMLSTLSGEAGNGG